MKAIKKNKQAVTVTIDRSMQKHLIIGGVVLVICIVVAMCIGLFVHANETNLTSQLPNHTFRIEEGNSNTPKYLQPTVKFAGKKTMELRASNGQLTPLHVGIYKHEIATYRKAPIQPGGKIINSKSVMKVINASHKEITLRPSYAVRDGQHVKVPKSYASNMTMRLIKK